MSERLIAARGCSLSPGDLWPTITATPYGSTNNGSPGDGIREQYATKGTPSLWTHAKKAGGVLNADWVEALMGVPLGWTADVEPMTDEDAEEQAALSAMAAESAALTHAESDATESGPLDEEPSHTSGNHLEPSRSRSQETEPD